MFSVITRLRCRTWLPLVLAVPFVFPADLCGDSQLGELTFSNSGARPRPIALERSLSMRTSARAKASTVDTMSDSVASYGFLGSVGGVAFGGVAEGEEGWKAVGLQYEASRVDGNRLVVRLKSPKRELRVNLPVCDWAFVPVARFAATDDVACFTLFGQLEDAAEQARRTQGKGRVLGYHTAFRDTLLGLRLMQADLLILDPSACDLPSERGRYILGPKEQQLLPGGRPDLVKSRDAFRAVGAILASAPAPFQSYVVCDEGRAIRFRVQGKELQITGDPYWYCWRSRISDQKTLVDLQKAAFQSARAKWEPEWNRELNQIGAKAFDLKWPQERRQAELQTFVDRSISANVIQRMPELSDKVSDAVRDQGGINPVVYSALQSTMRLSALFRHVRRDDAEGYGKFVESLRKARLVPEVTTPDFMSDRTDRPGMRGMP